MRGSPETMELLRPRSAAEAVAAYRRRPQALPLAGGTDFMVAWNMGGLNRKTVLDLSRVREWARIEESSGALLIGSLVTHSGIREHPAARRRFPLLARACGAIGAAQIQNRGTLGGNIANASPAGDTFPALAVYEAAVHAVSPNGARRIPFLDVFAGPKKTRLGPSELISAVELPVLKRRPSRLFFRKVATRMAQALSKTVAAGLLWLEPDGAVGELRFALGSMAPTVRRLKAAEAFLRGRGLDRAAIERAAELLEADVAPIDDVRSTARYRLEASKNLFKAFLRGDMTARVPL